MGRSCGLEISVNGIGQSLEIICGTGKGTHTSSGLSMWDLG